ncbi:hypothetical protein WJX74_001647 [Apatococcus lobatus]|uniref:KilA-N domain-containing protein n=1 Tax=Apatococcus lobatus TaxID=904363 RepID=A0AAW1QZR1_9CHLO
MSGTNMPSNYLTQVTDTKGNVLKVEMRADGYFNATKMCKSTQKRWDHYLENQRTQEFLEELSQNLSLPVQATGPSPVVQPMIHTMRGAKGGIWIHRKVAINLATWISPRFEVLVTDIADRYLTGQITTEESQAAAGQVAALFAVPDQGKIAEWNRRREESKMFTRESNLTIQLATGNRATGMNYAQLHDCVNWAATGRKTKQLRRELGIRGTPRDHMDALQLSMVTYVEGMGAQKVGEKRRLAEEDVTPKEAVEEVGRLAYKAHEFTKTTGGHGLPLLGQRPPTMEQLGRALAAARPGKMARLILEKAEMKPAQLRLAAPKKTGPMDRFLKPAVPGAVPHSELDLYD